MGSFRNEMDISYLNMDYVDDKIYKEAIISKYRALSRHLFMYIGGESLNGDPFCFVFYWKVSLISEWLESCYTVKNNHNFLILYLPNGRL